MFRKLATVAIVFAAATTAHAIPTLPPGVPDTLMVTAYYSEYSRTNLVGQSWSGCGHPSGSWGQTTSYRNVYFPTC